jgi:DNA-binding MarR family transcriptional regulator
MSGRLVREIRQTKPFGSPEEEAALNVHRTSAVLEEAFAGELRPHGLTGTQYNALRILRGAGPAGLACREIADRMVRRDPDVTRLLDRLESRGLVARARAPRDRRVVVTRITPAGLGLLSSLDASMRALPRRLLGHLGRKRLGLLIGLLEEARERP